MHERDGGVFGRVQVQSLMKCGHFLLFGFFFNLTAVGSSDDSRRQISLPRILVTYVKIKICDVTGKNPVKKRSISALRVLVRYPSVFPTNSDDLGRVASLL
jgi:hypothetical protein